MVSATFVEWMAETGSSVAEGQLIALVETAKATMEVTAPHTGFLIRGEAKPGDEIPLRSVVARIVRERPKSTSAVNADPGKRQADASTARDSVSTSPQSVAVRATPGARRLARARGVELSAVSAAGETIVESDVERYLGASEASLLRSDRTQAGDGYRRAMARAMAESVHIPQFTVAMDCDGEPLFAERDRLANAGMHFSVNVLLLRNVAAVLAKHPQMRMHWDGTSAKLASKVNVAVAIATPHGLVAPVIHAADLRSLEQLATEVRRLKTMAFEQRLGVEDVTGASFTVSNLGGYGVDDFTALVSAGQGAILAISAFKPWPRHKSDGSIAWALRARFRVSADHRAITGVDVAEFLRDLRASIESR